MVDKNENPMACCLCHEAIDVQPSGWSEGHNAEPAAAGRCCSDCNSSIVIPLRLMAVRDRMLWIGGRN